MATEISFRKMVGAYAFWWVMWFSIHAYVLHSMGFTSPIIWVESLTNTLFLAILGIILFNIMRYYRPDTGNYTSLRLIVLVMALSITAADNHLLKYIYPDNTAYLHFLSQSLPIRFCYIFLMTSFISLLNWLWYHFKDQQSAEARRADAEKLAREAELSKLREQLQPHFLFNSLNSISALVGSRPQEARHMIQQLSDFLRGTLRKDQQQLVTLEEELNHLQLYLDIEKVRFGHRLKTEINVGEASAQKKLPSLLLQPLVENAIKFGLYDTTEQVTIRIETRWEDGYLKLQVKNPFDPQTSNPQKGTGFGLSSVQRRLYLLYARNDLMQARAEGNTFITSIHIPQHD